LDVASIPAEIERLRGEQEAERSEIAALIKQTTAEIERLVPEKAEAARRLREVEGHLDRLPPSEVRSAYRAFHEIDLRLFMMQSQLEQLQYKQKVLERSLALLGEVAASLTRAAEESAPVEPPPPAGPDLARTLVAARARERQVIARYLHDFTAELLAGLVLRAQICERAVEMDPVRAREELRSLREALAERLQSTRLLIFELNPQILDEVGLVATIRRYVQLLERGFDTLLVPLGTVASDIQPDPPSIEVNVVGLDRRLPRPVEMGTFRIVQEALRNALAHARARRITITIEDASDAFRIEIADDGQGFDATAALNRAQRQDEGGLARMLAEAEAIGASLLITSDPGIGSSVRLAVPA